MWSFNSLAVSFSYPYSLTNFNGWNIVFIHFIWTVYIKRSICWTREYSMWFLAVRGFIGHLKEGGLIPIPHTERCYLWSSLHFTFTYNGGHIISANVSTDGVAPIPLDDHNSGDLNIVFSYSGTWYRIARNSQRNCF